MKHTLIWIIEIKKSLFAIFERSFHITSDQNQLVARRSKMASNPSGDVWGVRKLISDNFSHGRSIQLYQQDDR